MLKSDESGLRISGDQEMASKLRQGDGSPTEGVWSTADTQMLKTRLV
jgi:hypothetical protein